MTPAARGKDRMVRDAARKSGIPTRARFVVVMPNAVEATRTHATILRRPPGRNASARSRKATASAAPLSGYDSGMLPKTRPENAHISMSAPIAAAPRDAPRRTNVRKTAAVVAPDAAGATSSATSARARCGVQSGRTRRAAAAASRTGGLTRLRTLGWARHSRSRMSPSPKAWRKVTVSASKSTSCWSRTPRADQVRARGTRIRKDAAKRAAAQAATARRRGATASGPGPRPGGPPGR